MDFYASENEQLEALRQWWKDNGRMVVVGLAIGIAATAGWSLWSAHRAHQAERASLLYQQFVNASASSKPDAKLLKNATARLLKDHASSEYASLVALLAAQHAARQGDTAQAAQLLQWVIAHTKQPALGDLAELRLARLALVRKDYAGARAMLAQVHSRAYAIQVEELRGDIDAHQGKRAAARRAWKAALAAKNLPPAVRARLELKLDSLGRYNFPPAKTQKK